MFGGEEETVALRLPENMIGIILDRFGKDIDIRMAGEGMVSVRIKAAVSRQFYGWLTGLGAEITVTGPEHVRRGYIDYLENIMRNY